MQNDLKRKNMYFDEKLCKINSFGRDCFIKMYVNLAIFLCSKKSIKLILQNRGNFRVTLQFTEIIHIQKILQRRKPTLGLLEGFGFLEEYFFKNLDCMLRPFWIF